VDCAEKKKPVDCWTWPSDPTICGKCKHEKRGCSFRRGISVKAVKPGRSEAVGKEVPEPGEILSLHTERELDEAALAAGPSTGLFRIFLLFLRNFHVF
jgi:hypothetical protein